MKTPESQPPVLLGTTRIDCKDLPAYVKFSPTSCGSFGGPDMDDPATAEYFRSLVPGSFVARTDGTFISQGGENDGRGGK